MLSKRAVFMPRFSETESSPVTERPQSVSRLRLETRITFIPSRKQDMVKEVDVFLREVNQPELPFQITIVLNDTGMRLGYYDLSYKNSQQAQAEYKRVIAAVEAAREEIEFEQKPSSDIEKITKKHVSKVLKYAVRYDSTYTDRSRVNVPS